VKLPAPIHRHLHWHVLLALALGGVGGYAFALLKLPLAWMIGAMVVTTVAALWGAPIRLPASWRAVMVAVLGTMLGSAFKPDVLDHVARWGWSLITLVGFVVAITATVAYGFARLWRFGRVTAFFAAAPGGFGEMWLLGIRYGGDSSTIALVHSVRIMLTVFMIPFWFRLFYGYTPGAVPGLGLLGELALKDAGLLAACAAAGFWGGRLIRLPAAALVGPMALSAAAHLTGVTAASPPNEIVNVAQVVIGTAIGCRFAGFELRKVFATMAIGALVTVYMVAAAVAVALALERLTGLPFTALILAFAPGGLAEMTLVSLALGIDTAFVSTHHLVRMLILVLGAPLAFRLFKGAFDDGTRAPEKET
jgi:hypothetical protein